MVVCYKIAMSLYNIWISEILKRKQILVFMFLVVCTKYASLQFV